MLQCAFTKKNNTITLQCCIASQTVGLNDNRATVAMQPVHQQTVGGNAVQCSGVQNIIGAGVEGSGDVAA